MTRKTSSREKTLQPRSPSRRKTKRTAQPWKIDEFEVGEGGQLVSANFYHPRIRDDIYNISIERLNSPKDLFYEMDSCRPLEWAIYARFEDFEDSLKTRLEKAMKQPTHTRRIETLKAQLTALPERTEEGAREWVAHLDERRFRAIVKHVAKWLRKPWDVYEEDYADRYTAYGRALDYFRNMDLDSLTTLGVKVIEGEFPGSSYYAAELRQPIEDANRAAEENGIPVRFVKMSAETRRRYGWSAKQCGPRLRAPLVT